MIWDQISGFIRHTFRPIEWNFPEWSGEAVLTVAKAKKAKAGIGADGVSRADLVHLPPSGHDALSHLFEGVERGAL